MEQSTAIIISAILTGIIGPIITLIIKNRIEQVKYPTPAKARLRMLIDNIWSGDFSQIDPVDNTKTFRTAITFRFKAKGRIVIGEANLIMFGNIPTVLVIKNGIFDGDILKIEYENINRGIFQKGSIALEMNAFGNALEGMFVGYSPNLKKIISGEGKLTNANKS